MSNPQVARTVGVSLRTAGRWRALFAAQGLAGLEDAGPVGRPKAALVVSAGERTQLQRWARRAKIVLRAAEGGTDKQIAAELGLDTSTVQRWRSRFTERRLDGLSDEPRPGRPPSITLDQVEDVIVATLESTPGPAVGGDTHWSRAAMAQRSGLSKSTIGRI